MKIEITHRYSNEILFSIESGSLKLAVEAAVKSKASLNGASLDGASLNGASLNGASLDRASLDRASLNGASLNGASLDRASLDGASLDGASLNGASLNGASLDRASLYGASLNGASLDRASLYRASLDRASLYGASLNGASLNGANLYGASLDRASLYGASLDGASLDGAKGMVKIMGVEAGNYYWKRFDKGLNNNGYQFKVGMNSLREGEVFASDDRVACSSPGFHFASRSWCAVNYPQRPLEAHIRIPEDAQINEPWATDGKASADKIEILQVFDVATGEDVTEKYR